jgi:hypothetical protein
MILPKSRFEQPTSKGRLTANGITALLFAFVLSGCVSIPTEKYQALKTSGEEVLNSTTATFAKIENLQRHYEVVVAPDAPLSTNSFEPPLVGRRTTDIIPQLRFREDAIRTLAKYLTVLEAFSSKDYESAVDAAAVDLAGSVQNLEGSAGAIPSKDAENAGGIFATVVDVIGRATVQEKQMKALKTVMRSAQGGVNTMCVLIAHDNEEISQDIDLMMGRIIAHAEADRPAYHAPGRLDYDERIALEISDAKAIKQSLNAISDAVAQIPIAHKEIQDSIEKKPTGFEGLKALAQEANRANDFYLKLK